MIILPISAALGDSEVFFVVDASANEDEDESNLRDDDERSSNDVSASSDVVSSFAPKMACVRLALHSAMREKVSLSSTAAVHSSDVFAANAPGSNSADGSSSTPFESAVSAAATRRNDARAAAAAALLADAASRSRSPAARIARLARAPVASDADSSSSAPLARDTSSTAAANAAAASLASSARFRAVANASASSADRTSASADPSRAGVRSRPVRSRPGRRRRRHLSGEVIAGGFGRARGGGGAFARLHGGERRAEFFDGCLGGGRREFARAVHRRVAHQRAAVECLRERLHHRVVGDVRRAARGGSHRRSRARGGRRRRGGPLGRGPRSRVFARPLVIPRREHAVHLDAKPRGKRHALEEGDFALGFARRGGGCRCGVVDRARRGGFDRVLLLRGLPQRPPLGPRPPTAAVGGALCRFRALVRALFGLGCDDPVVPRERAGPSRSRASARGDDDPRGRAGRNGPARATRGAGRQRGAFSADPRAGRRARRSPRESPRSSRTRRRPRSSFRACPIRAHTRARRGDRARAAARPTFRTEVFGFFGGADRARHVDRAIPRCRARNGHEIGSRDAQFVGEP